MSEQKAENAISTVKDITIETPKGELHFAASIDDYNKFINDVKETSKVVPAKQFLKRTVKKESKALLNDFIISGYALELCGLVTDELVPTVEFAVKK